MLFQNIKKATFSVVCDINISSLKIVVPQVVLVVGIFSVSLMSIPLIIKTCW